MRQPKVRYLVFGPPRQGGPRFETPSTQNRSTANISSLVSPSAASLHLCEPLRCHLLAVQHILPRLGFGRELGRLLLLLRLQLLLLLLRLVLSRLLRLVRRDGFLLLSCDAEGEFRNHTLPIVAMPVVKLAGLRKWTSAT